MVVLAISLTSLGIKLPSAPGISSTFKPKPRPRAIIKNQITTCKQIIKKIPPAVVVTGFEPVACLPATALPTLPSPICRRSAAIDAQTLPRPPPQLS